MKPGDGINKHKNCLSCGDFIEYDHHFGRCWKCVCKERLKYYEEGLKIYERLHNKYMIERTKNEIERWRSELKSIQEQQKKNRWDYIEW